MTDIPQTADDETATTLSGPTMIDGRPTRGPMVVDEQDGRAVLWQVNLAGSPCGAWVLRYEGVDTFRRLLGMCDRRGLIAVDREAPVKLLGRWASECGVRVDSASLEARICSIPTLIEETAQARQKCVTAVRDKETAEGKRLAPLSWKTRLPAPVRDELDFLVQAAAIRVPANGEVSDQALAVARLAEWAIPLCVRLP